MLPKVCLFQCFRWALRSLSLDCILYIHVEPMTWVFSHQFWIISENSGCESQKFSNLKGFLFVVSPNCHWKLMGQWYEPTVGRIEVESSSFLSMRCSVMRKRSSLLAIWAAPPLWLFQVWMPLLVLRSINPLLSMNYLKRLSSGERRRCPPLLSSREVMRLKLPPKTSMGWG